MRFSALSAREFMNVAKMILRGEPQGQKFIQRMVDDIVSELKDEEFQQAMGGKDDYDDDDLDNIDLSDLGL
jgi:hypothetical protein